MGGGSGGLSNGDFFEGHGGPVDGKRGIGAFRGKVGGDAGWCHVGVVERSVECCVGCGGLDVCLSEGVCRLCCG